MSSVVVSGDTSGSITISAPAISGTNTLTLPVATDTLVGKATTDTLTNKTVTAPVLSGTVTGTYTLGGTPTLTAPILSGSVTGTYTLAGTPTMGASLITSGTAVASTSGTSIDFTGLPSWIRRVTVMYSNVSTNGTSHFLIQIGSGSVTASGYSSMSVYTGAGSGGTGVVTTGFALMHGSGAEAHSGSFTICLLGSFSYVFSGVAGWNAGGTYGALSGGYSPALSGALDRVRFTTVSSDTFDLCSVNILYE